MQPKGSLLLIGGHEDKGEIAGENLTIQKKNKSTSHFEILGELIDRVPREHHIIEIIAAASSIPDEMEAWYINAYQQAGFTHVGIINVANVQDANDPVSIQRVKGAHAVFFTGGDQEKLIALLAGTDLLTAIKTKYHADKHFVVGGTSAGAMCIPETIITGGPIREAIFKKDIKIATGFNLISNVIVDTHFIKRGRFARLAHAVALHPTCLGIGLGEDTALLITNGNHAECMGSGMVIFINGSEMRTSNIEEADDNTPITVENIKVDIIADGSYYLLAERKSTSSETGSQKP